MRSFLLLLTIFALVSGCQSGSDMADLPPISETGASMVLGPMDFSDLPGWDKSDQRPALGAFRRTCAVFLAQEATGALSDELPYAGTYMDWKTPCAKIERVRKSKGAARAFFEEHFEPLRVSTEDEASKLTAYYEPEILASREAKEGLVEIPGIPSDLALLDISDFDPALGKHRFSAQFRDNRLRPYPVRADIVDETDKALGFADPMEVYYLQIQGSGRVVFSKGKAIRAVFAAHNNHPFKSIAQHLIQTGQIDKSQASMEGVKAWAEQTNWPQVQAAMNINPRYVWFEARPLDDFRAGPEGAHGVPLTAMGSLAIDPAFYPYGVPIYVDSKKPDEAGDWKGKTWRRLLIAQDTGGAIKGGLRGDVFFGSGAAAGGLAGNMNHPGQFWVLLPKNLVSRLKTS